MGLLRPPQNPLVGCRGVLRGPCWLGRGGGQSKGWPASVSPHPEGKWWVRCLSSLEGGRLLAPQSDEVLCSEKASLPVPPPRALRDDGRSSALVSASWSPHRHPMYHRELSPQNLSKQSVNRIFTPFVQYSDK